VTVSRGTITITVAVVALFIASAFAAPTSLDRGSVLTMLPFAAVLAIAALGQNLVVMQGGIDLSVPGAISLAVVITTHQAHGDNSLLLPALGLGFVVAIVAGIANGILVGRLGLNPIVATLGTNALLYAGVLGSRAERPAAPPTSWRGPPAAWPSASRTPCTWPSSSSRWPSSR
jgi:ribose transport system permease protein